MILQKKVQIERMTWPEVKEAVRESSGIAIVPVGAVEEHGPHLPTGTDSIETYEIGLQAAKKAGVVITPLVWFGNSRSLWISLGLLQSIRIPSRCMCETFFSLVKHGFDRPSF